VDDLAAFQDPSQLPVAHPCLEICRGSKQMIDLAVNWSTNHQMGEVTVIR
jgi:hypothetical protein